MFALPERTIELSTVKSTRPRHEFKFASVVGHLLSDIGWAKTRDIFMELDLPLRQENVPTRVHMPESRCKQYKYH